MRLLPLLALPLAACAFGGQAPAPSIFDTRGPEPVFDVPYVATPYPVVRAMLDLAGVGPGDRLIDLGSGDGRIVIEAAKRGASGLGVEIDPGLVARAQGYARGEGVEHLARFRRQDLFQTPLAEASVVTLYLLPEVNRRLVPRLLTEARPGTRIVAHAFDLGDWRPDATREADGARLFLWTVPAQVAGAWRIAFPDGREATLVLDQSYQDVSGTLDGLALSDVVLEGARLVFTAVRDGRPLRIAARMGDAALAPDPDGDGTGGWSARRIYRD